MGSAYEACVRFTDSKVRCLVLALIYSFGLFAIGSVAWLRKDVNDDFSIAAALSGNWGDGDGLCLFVSGLWSQVVYFLNTTIPQFNWFTLLEILTVCLSVAVMAYLALTRISLPMAGAFLASLLVMIFVGCVWQPNFTYVAIVGVCAGGLCLGLSLRDERHNPSLIVWGLVLFCLGALWRMEVFMLSIPMFGVGALLCVFSSQKRAAGVVRSLVRLWPYAVVLCLFAGIYAYDAAVWHDDPWHGWRDYSNARAALSDFPVKSYEEVGDELEALGVSENDYELIRDTKVADPDFFTLERLKAVAAVAAVDPTSPEQIAKEMKTYFTEKVTDSRFLLSLFMMLVVILATQRGPARRSMIVLLVLALAVSLVLAAGGRLPQRVHFPIWLFAFAACLPFAQPNAAASQKDAGKSAVAPLAESLTGVAAVAACLLVVVGISAMSIMHYSPNRVMATYASRAFVPESATLSYLEDHPSNVYVFDSEMNMRFDYTLRGLPDHEVLYRTPTLEGWTNGAPFCDRANEAIGMPNLIKGLVDNKSAYLVKRGSSKPETLTVYLQEHYYPNCTCELADSFKDPINGGELCVFKFTA